MQMNMVAMGIANDGKIMQPNLVKRVIAPDLKVLSETKPKEFRTATSKDVADQVTDLMRGPVKSGTAVGRRSRAWTLRPRPERRRSAGPNW